MGAAVRQYAIQLLRRLRRPVSVNNEMHEEDETMDKIKEAPAFTSPYLLETLAIPAEKPEILQHIELLFALSAKVPEFLDESVPSVFANWRPV